MRLHHSAQPCLQLVKANTRVVEPLTSATGWNDDIARNRKRQCELLGQGIWFADGGIVSFKGFDYPTRMAAVRMADGGLWLWSPVAKTAAIEAEVRSLGPVRHLVSPNKLHYLFLAEWQASFPEAKLWATAETIRKCPDLQFTDALAVEAPAAWQGQIDQFYFNNSPFMDELIFIAHRAPR